MAKFDLKDLEQLGFDSTTPEATICKSYKTQFRKLALLKHPDKFDQRLFDQKNKEFKELSQAYTNIGEMCNFGKNGDFNSSQSNNNPPPAPSLIQQLTTIIKNNLQAPVETNPKSWSTALQKDINSFLNKNQQKINMKLFEFIEESSLLVGNDYSFGNVRSLSRAEIAFALHACLHPLLYENNSLSVNEKSIAQKNLDTILYYGYFFGMRSKLNSLKNPTTNISGSITVGQLIRMWNSFKDDRGPGTILDPKVVEDELLSFLIFLNFTRGMLLAFNSLDKSVENDKAQLPLYQESIKTVVQALNAKDFSKEESIKSNVEKLCAQVTYLILLENLSTEAAQLIPFIKQIKNSEKFSLTTICLTALENSKHPTVLLQKLENLYEQMPRTVSYMDDKAAYPLLYITFLLGALEHKQGNNSKALKYLTDFENFLEKFNQHPSRSDMLFLPGSNTFIGKLMSRQKALSKQVKSSPTPIPPLLSNPPKQSKDDPQESKKPISASPLITADFKEVTKALQILNNSLNKLATTIR